MQGKNLKKTKQNKNIHFLNKNSQQAIEGNFLSMIKSNHKKPTANMILNNKRLIAFPPKIRNKGRLCILITSTLH